MAPPATIEIRYKCACMQDEVGVDVRQRLELEDIVNWVEVTVAAAVSNDHFKRSPRCFLGKTEYVKIPMAENAPFIGAAPKLDS